MTDSYGTKTLMGIGAILNVVVFAGASLPEPFNWLVAGAAAILGIGVILDIVDVI